MHAFFPVFPNEQRSEIFRCTHLVRDAGSADALQFRRRCYAQEPPLRRSRRRIFLRIDPGLRDAGGGIPEVRFRYRFGLYRRHR